MHVRRLVLTLVGAVVMSLLMAVSASANGGQAPRITGVAQVGSVLTAHPVPDDGAVSHSYQWLKGVSPTGFDAPRLKLGAGDVGARISVRVTAHFADGQTQTTVSAVTARVAKGVIVRRERPTIAGKNKAKYATKLRATKGRWSVKPDSVTYRWLRNDKPIAGATSRVYTVRASDVGAKIRVRVTARKAGYRSESWQSRAIRGKHVVPVRRVVTYDVQARGKITADLATFKRRAQATYDDPRGWRAMGVEFKRVKKSGDFTLVLSQASKVPTFHSACSAAYSCRVGRYVIINQDRWTGATDPWNKAGGSKRDYQHMVVNHETGHWFGKWHATCGGKGKKAPVMMQQSKGLGGCAFNPWPLKSELK